jgi:hypothetical protein
VPAFGAQEMCARYVVPPGANLIELSSHNHKRGKRFRIWEGAFACAGGVNAGKPCSPFGPEPGFDLDDPCQDTGCVSQLPPRAGDCNADLRVTVDELILGVNLALELAAVGECPRFDADGDGHVGVDEIILGVSAAIDPSLRDPQESLLYTSLSYADPAVRRFDPPLRLGGRLGTDVERTLTYCSLYDNGFTEAGEVKRRSTSPPATNGFPGGPCAAPEACTAGAVGIPCSIDRHCDTAPGAGDGECDACSIRFGVTTEDEMFILLGAYYAD